MDGARSAIGLESAPHICLACWYRLVQRHTCWQQGLEFEAGGSMMMNIAVK
jgi:hypothetical protein